MVNKPVYNLTTVDGEVLYTGSYEKCKSMWQQVDNKQWFDVVNRDTGRPVNQRFLYTK